MKPDYYCKEREVFTMAFVKKTWKDRIAEFPTRRRLTKEDNTSELVTVAREEGTLSQEGDAFSAENMNDLENRIDAEFTEVNGKLEVLTINPNTTVPAKGYAYCELQLPNGYRAYGVNTLTNSLAIQATLSEFADIKRITFYNAYTESINLEPVAVLIYRE